MVACLCAGKWIIRVQLGMPGCSGSATIPVPLCLSCDCTHLSYFYAGKEKVNCITNPPSTHPTFTSPLKGAVNNLIFSSCLAKANNPFFHFLHLKKKIFFTFKTWSFCTLFNFSFSYDLLEWLFSFFLR